MPTRGLPRAHRAHHYGDEPLACVDCHGGDPAATTKQMGHPTTTTVSFNPTTPGVHDDGGRLLAGASLRELGELDPERLQFLNPANYRVVDRTCGSVTLGDGNCHAAITDASLLSTHAALAGQLAGGLYFGGLTDNAPHERRTRRHFRPTRVLARRHLAVVDGRKRRGPRVPARRRRSVG